MFCNSAVSGALILAGLTVGDPMLGAMAALGTVSATATAKVCSVDEEMVTNGLAGYNGCLVGCAFSVFLGAPVLGTALATVAGAHHLPHGLIERNLVMTLHPRLTSHWLQVGQPPPW